MSNAQVLSALRTEHKPPKVLVGEGSQPGGSLTLSAQEQGRMQHCKKSIKGEHCPEDFGEPFNVESGYCLRCGHPGCSKKLEVARAECSAAAGKYGKLLYWENSSVCGQCEHAKQCAEAMAARKAHCPKHLASGPHPEEHGSPYHPQSLHCKTCSKEQITACAARCNLPG